MTRAYATPEAFKQALEQRLRTAAGSGARLGRARQLLVFDRFLARVVAVLGDAVTLKGGVALELRLERARTTMDVDLRVIGSPGGMLEKLRAAARRDMGDFMAFEVAADTHHPEMQNPGMRYEGLRFRTVCKLAGKLYGHPFGLDVAFGEPILGEADVVRADDVLDFAGVAPPTLRLYPVVTHLAEKLHAYTMPRAHPNSRVKDLPDIALLGSIQTLDASVLRAAFEQTFAFRRTHSLPSGLPDPPDAWAGPYSAMAREDRLAWPTLEEVTGAARAFMDPVLVGEVTKIWNPAHWSWEPR